MAFADVIYFYSGNITVGLAKTQPMTFTYNGQTAGPNGNFSGYIMFNGSNTGFTVNLNITNSSAAYFYEAGYLTVNTAGSIYVSSITTTGTTDLVGDMIIYIQSTTTGATQASFVIINAGQTTTTPSSTFSLSPGTYYISIYIVPNTPLPYTSPPHTSPPPSGGHDEGPSPMASTETIAVNFGYNLVSASAIPQPGMSWVTWN